MYRRLCYGKLSMRSGARSAKVQSAVATLPMSKIDAAYKRRSISDAPVTFGSLVRVDGDNALQAGQYAGIGERLRGSACKLSE